jgi:hypothetical protein
MHIRRFLTTTHQRQRLVLWALAMLAWFAAVLFARRNVTARQVRQRRDVSLDRLTRTTVHLLMVRAGELRGWRPTAPKSFFKRGRDLRRRHFIRSILGARLRRVLRYRGGPAQRIQNLMRVLRHLDDYARLVFRRKLTRLFPITTSKFGTAQLQLRPQAEGLFAPPACDTS